MLYFLYFSFNLFTLYIYMPSKIRILQDHTINKIAAGEVIENPASVVKELVENAIDAGSTDICVEIKEGGRQLIRVIDNGEGMSSDDALLCLERHATSKIREVEDIYSLATMGFRGEAIPSIAAISKFTLLTCQRKEEKNQEGTLIKVEGGQLLSHGPAVRSYGTTVEVK
jgi:DNA mismatch repair protein MutL